MIAFGDFAVASHAVYQNINYLIAYLSSSLSLSLSQNRRSMLDHRLSHRWYQTSLSLSLSLSLCVCVCVCVSFSCSWLCNDIYVLVISEVTSSRGAYCRPFYFYWFYTFAIFTVSWKVIIIYTFPDVNIAKPRKFWSISTCLYLSLLSLSLHWSLSLPLSFPASLLFVCVCVPLSAFCLSESVSSLTHTHTHTHTHTPISSSLSVCLTACLSFLVVRLLSPFPLPVSDEIKALLSIFLFWVVYSEQLTLVMSKWILVFFHIAALIITLSYLGSALAFLQGFESIAFYSLTHTHTHSLSLTHTHSHTLSLSLSHKLSCFIVLA